MTRYESWAAAFGFLFSLLSILLIALLLLTEPSSPDLNKNRNIVDGNGLYPPIWLCDSSPDWAFEAIGEAMALWEEQCYITAGFGIGSCEELCYHQTKDQEPIFIECAGPEFISISGVDPDQRWGTDRVAGMAYTPGNPNLLPQIEISLRPRGHDQGVYLLAHEIGHAFNRDHAYIKILRWKVNAKNNVMHPNVNMAGPRMDGVPKGASCD